MTAKKSLNESTTRIARSVSFPPDQDAWLSELLGKTGNLSGFIQALVEAARNGKIDTDDLLKNQEKGNQLDRATAYLKAKEAGLMFEDDVARIISWVLGKLGLNVVRGRIHNGSSTFVADFSIEQKDGTVVCSVICKSSPRADRLQLALAEAMIGAQKTGKPVIVVVPYFLNQDAKAREVLEQYKVLGYKITDLENLPTLIREAATK